MPDRSGQQLGNYRLVRLLGQGGFADVYLGEHLHLETQVAIKVLHIQMGRSEQESFRQEAKTLAHLVHPHIVRVLDFGVEERTPFLVMEYAVHGTLRQLHPKGSILPLPTIVRYIQQVADALHYTHEKRLIHRDIKPENMLLDTSWQILLSDFGIATLAHSSNQLLTQDKIGAGTAPYTAPEQIKGKPRTASDQYSLGIVVYEWLTGARPFQGDPLAIYYQHLHVAPAPLQEQVSGISPLVEQVVLTALAKEPTERFASIQAFANALTQTVQVNQISLLIPPPSAVLIQSSEPEQHPVPEQPDSIPSAPVSESRPSLSSEHITQPPQDPTSLEEEKARGKPIPDNNHKKGSTGRRASRSKVVFLSVLVILVVLALGGGIVWLVGGNITSPTRTITSPTGTITSPTGTITSPTGTITEFRILTSGSRPIGITSRSDGNLWFTEYNSNQIGRITPSGTITEFPITTSASGPQAITVGPDSNLWFTERDGNQIGRITPNGTITEFPITTSASSPVGITAGPDGNLWFTEFTSNQIGRISPSGTITEFPITTSASGPSGITAGPDGNLWFTEVSGNNIGRITPNGTITEFPITTSASQTFVITAGPDGNLWFTEYHGNNIGRISPSGTITEFPITTSASSPVGITVGPDGNLWFTERDGNNIGRITPNGTITEFPIATPQSGPQAITAGLDGNLWFTGFTGNNIGRITTGK